MRGDRGRPYTSPHWVTDAWSAIADDRVVRVVVDAAGGVIGVLFTTLVFQFFR